MSGDPGWIPKLVALDIDGTLLKWVEEEGATYEQIPARLAAVIHAAEDAGVHVVLASGRAPHGMTRIADLLALRGAAGHRDQPLWIVASNGAVLCRYDVGGELDVVHEETFDPAPAVHAILAARPGARIAVEERGVGYRVTSPFPTGELGGDTILTSLEELVAEPVSRVIVRDPDATVEEFVDLAGGLGLHGTDFVVGWTAWLDLTPVGVSKASGLAHVCAELGLDVTDVLAIGDGRNDVEMLRWAGRGVAMGQAVEEVRAAADAVTETVYDDGASVELERYFG